MEKTLTGSVCVGISTSCPALMRFSPARVPVVGKFRGASGGGRPAGVRRASHRTDRASAGGGYFCGLRERRTLLPFASFTGSMKPEIAAITAPGSRRRRHSQYFNRPFLDSHRCHGPMRRDLYVWDTHSIGRDTAIEPIVVPPAFDSRQRFRVWRHAAQRQRASCRQPLGALSSNL